MHSPTVTRRRTADPLPPTADPDGDRERFAALYARHRDELARYCRTILRHDQDVEDALQSTMAKAFAALRTETREIAVRPWLFRIAHNEAITIVRRRVDPVELDDRDGGDPDLVPRAVETRERLRLLRDDLRDLPDRQRSALVLRELSGLGHREIAEVLGSSPSAVKQAIYEARCGLGDCATGRSLDCDQVRRALSDGDGRTAGRRRLRAHLRSCRACRAFDVALRQRPQDLGALFPAGPMVGAGGAITALSGLLSGGGAAAGGGSATVGAGATSVGVGTTGSTGLLGGVLAGAGGAKLAGVAAVAVITGGGAVAVERGTFASSGADSGTPSVVIREAPSAAGPTVRLAATLAGSAAVPAVVPVPGGKGSSPAPDGDPPRRGDRAPDASHGGHRDAGGSPATRGPSGSGPDQPASSSSGSNGRSVRGARAERSTARRPADTGAARSAATKTSRGPRTASAAIKRSPPKTTGKPSANAPAPPGKRTGSASAGGSGSAGRSARAASASGSGAPSAGSGKPSAATDLPAADPPAAAAAPSPATAAGGRPASD